jgi:hypothetical protein
MVYINKLDSFADAEKRYNDTKPVHSKHHTLEQDVRPVGKRSRKWERIIKVDDSTYVLSCGGFFDSVFGWGPGDETFRRHYPVTTEEVVRLAPIVWRKHKDGTETITIRNGAGDWSHNAVYSFVSRALPSELWFRQTREGKQFIYNRSQGQTVHLPKTTSAPCHVLEYYKDQLSKTRNRGWIEKYAKSYTPGDDGLSVTFKREANGTFTLVGEAHKVMVDRTRINKTMKSDFKADIAGLFESATALYPLMRTQLGATLLQNTSKDLQDIAKELSIEGYKHSYGSLFKQSDTALVRDILKNPEHPMRHGLNIAAMFELHYAMRRLDGDEQNDAHNTPGRACFNKWINTLGGFTVTTREEK